MKIGLGPPETSLFAYTQLRAPATVRQGMVAAALQSNFQSIQRSNGCSRVDTDGDR